MPTPTQRLVYLNGSGVDETSTSFKYADMVRSGRGWETVGGGGTVPLDRDVHQGGDLYPATDASIICASGAAMPFVHGLYTIYTTGRSLGTNADGTPNPNDPLGGLAISNGTVVSKNYDAPSNTGTVTIQVAPFVGDSLFRIQAHNTRRLPGDTTPTGLVFKCMRPTTLGGSTSHDPSELFSRPALTLYAGVHGWRDLNDRRCNGWPDNYVLVWAARRSPADPLAAGPLAQGMATEDQALFANADPRGIKPDLDLYRCIPHCADDDYILQQALADCWGTDGVNAHTGVAGSATTFTLATGTVLHNPQPSGGPKYPGVNGRIELQWSDEMDFNDGGAFGGQFNQVSVQAFNYWYPQLPALTDVNWDGSQDNEVIRKRWIGKRTKRISDLYRQVFGDAAFGVKFFPVLMGQEGTPTTIQPAIDYIVKARGGDPAQGSTAANQALLAQDISYLGTGLYRNLNAPSLDLAQTSVDQVIGSGLQPSAAHVGVAFAQSWGRPFCSYEGGGFRSQDTTTTQTTAVDLDSRMHRLFRADLDESFTAGAEILCVFQDSSPAGWPTTRNSYDLTSGPYQAMVAGAAAWSANPAGAVSTDPLPPLATITGVTITLPPGPVVGGATLTPTVVVSGTNSPITDYAAKATLGTISGNSLTLPPSANAPVSVLFTATSTIDPTQSASATIVVPAVAGAAPPVRDASFEQLQGLPPDNHAFQADPTGLPWTFTGPGQTGVADNRSDNAQKIPTPFGDQFAVLAQQCLVTQAGLNFTTTGQYTLTLAARQSNLGRSTQTIQVEIDGVAVATITPANTTWGLYTTPAFAVAAGNRTLGLRALGSNTDANANLYDNALVDNVSFALVSNPPPSVVPPSAPTLTIHSANGVDTITYTAPVAGSNPVRGVSLFAGTTAGGENDLSAVNANLGVGGGTFTHAAGGLFYTVEAFDTALPVATFSAASNEVQGGPAPAPPTGSFSPLRLIEMLIQRAHHA